MNQYDAWRESEVKRVGLKTQLAAESMLDRQAAEPTVTLNDDRTGTQIAVKKSIADTYRKRGYATLPVIHSFPSEAYKLAWERIFAR